MIRNLLCLAAGTIILTGCIHVHETKHITEDKSTREPARILRHVVLFKFKDDKNFNCRNTLSISRLKI